MNRIINTFMLLCYFSIANAQFPVLVTDYNEGSEDSFDQWNFKAITFNDKIIFPLVDIQRGEELGIMQDDEVKLLKDIDEGSESSEPENFILFNQKVYFSAFDVVNGGALWSTDGTEENTKIAFSFMPVTSAKPNGLTISKSGWLYYTKGNILYRTDGTVNEEIYTGVSFATSFQHRSNNYCTYKEEVAFAVSNGQFVDLYAVQGDEVVLLATSPNVGSFNEVYGLSEVENGLILGIDGLSSAENTGTYSYNEGTSNLSNITIAGDEARRLHPVNNDKSLAWVGGEGYFLTNGIQGQEFGLFSTSNTSSTQGQGITNVVSGDNLIFHATEGTFGDDFIYYVDAANNLSTKLFESSQYVSNFIVQDEYAFLASGVSNGADPKLYYINMTDGTFKNFYSYNEGSFSGPSIFVMGVVGDKLYYTSNLDADVGRELYSIELGLIINAKDVEVSPFEFSFTNTTYQVNTEENENLRMELFTTDGKLVSTETILANRSYSLPACEGMCYMAITLRGHTIVHKFVTIK